LKKEKDEKEALLDQFFQVMFKWVIILISSFYVAKNFFLLSYLCDIHGSQLSRR
jgi:hypothetical protein